MSQPPFINTASIAGEYGFEIETVRHWHKTGQLPPSAKIGRHRVWKRADIEAWFESKFN